MRSGKVPLQTPFTGLDCLWLPRTILTSDFVVSMPKLKTHHWAGVTLSMKNLFGVMRALPMAWPEKTLLHWKGHRSEHPQTLTRRFRHISSLPTGSLAMEGNGPAAWRSA